MKKKTFAPQKGTWLPMVLLLLMTLRLGMHVAHAERSLPCVRSADDGSWDCDCKNSEEVSVSYILMFCELVRNTLQV